MRDDLLLAWHYLVLYVPFHPSLPFALLVLLLFIFTQWQTFPHGTVRTQNGADKCGPGEYLSKRLWKGALERWLCWPYFAIHLKRLSTVTHELALQL